MSNGAILTEQIIVPSETANRGNLRIFDDAGWKPDASFYNRVKNDLNSFASLGTKVPKAILRDAKIFIQIDFIRPKKIVYLIIKDHDQSFPSEYDTDRLFGLVYRTIYGTVVAYGKHTVFAEVCKIDQLYYVIFRTLKINLT